METSVSGDHQSVSALCPRLNTYMHRRCSVPLQEVIKEAEVEWWMDAEHTLLQFASLHRPAINVHCILTAIHFFFPDLHQIFNGKMAVDLYQVL